MIKLSNKKLTVICILLVVVLVLSIIENVIIHNENNKLKNEQIKQMTTEWYEVYELSRQVDNYIELNCIDGEKHKFMDQSSSIYKKESERVKDFSIKYQKIVDNYFKGL